jgi:hypothetical protein
MKIRNLAVLLGSLATLAACEGLKDALTAHVDVAAKASDRELSVTRLSDLLGNSQLQIPANRETAGILAELWMDYQLLAKAAARGDSTADPKIIDEATLGITANVRLKRFMDNMSATMKADSGSETSYNQGVGGIFVARHILFATQNNFTPQQRDSVRKKAEGVRKELTTANFPAMAKKYSADPGSATRGGDLGAFNRGDMVKPFSDALAALRPGEISPLVETNYGFHIIQRPTYASAKGEYDPAFTQMSKQRAESVFVAKLDNEGNITIKKGAATAAKGAARDLSGHYNDNDVLASYKGGQLTVGRFARWVESYPPNLRLPQQMAQAPDSLVDQFVKSIARNELMLKKADSAGIVMSADEKKQLYSEFSSIQAQLWQQLGIDPKSLADSAKSQPERERLAASRVEAYLDAIMAGRAQPLSVPTPVKTVLMAKYPAKIYPAGVDRAVERAKKVRQAADSTRAAQQPRTQVPLPGRPDSSTGAAPNTKRP